MSSLYITQSMTSAGTVGGNFLMFPVPDIANLDDTYNAIRIYSSSTRNGTFAFLANVAFSSTTSAYTYTDTTSAAWYKFSWYHTGTHAESAQSEPFPSQNIPLWTRAQLRELAAESINLYGLPDTEYTMPQQFTTTAAGAANGSTVWCTTFTNTRWWAKRWSDWYLYVTSGTYSGQCRPISAWSNGQFTMAANFGGQIASDVTFEILGGGPVGWWNDRINETFSNVWVPFEIAITGETNVTEYRLPYYVQNTGQVFTIDRRDGSTLRQYASYPGPLVDLQNDVNGGFKLLFRAGLITDGKYIIRGARNPAQMFSDSATVGLSDKILNLTKKQIAYRAVRALSLKYGAQGEDRRYWDNLKQILSQEISDDISESGMLIQTASNIRGNDMIDVSGNYRLNRTW